MGPLARLIARFRENPSLVLGAGLAFGLQVSGIGLSYLAQVLLARWLGATAYGQYNYAVIWASLLAVFATLGFPTVVLRFAPEYIVKKNWALFSGLFRASNGLSLLAGLWIAGVFWLGVRLAAPRLGLDPALPGVLERGAWLIPLLALLSLNEEFFKSFRRVGFAYFPHAVLRPLVLLGGSYLLYKATGGLDAQSTLLVLYAAIVFALSVHAWGLWRLLPRPALRTPPAYDFAAWWEVALPLLLMSAFLLLLKHTDVLLIGLFLDTKNVGIYNAAAKTATLVGFVLIAVSAVVAPRISALYAEGRLFELQRLLHYAAHATFWPSLAIGGALILGGRAVLGFFGEEFVAAYSALVFLVLGQLANAAAGPVVYLLNLTGHQRESLRVYGYSALLNGILNAAAIPSWGIEGAAIATMASMMVWNLWLHRLAARRLGLCSSIVAALKGSCGTASH